MTAATNDGKAPYLRVVDLTKKFGTFTALKDISLDVFEGEFVCFLGPSGCGKTTLLRAIAGLDLQTSGRIDQAGRDISALPPAERDFGIVFQSYALFPNLTVNKNVAYGLENRKLPRREVQGRVEELLDLVGLPEQGRKYPAQLSGGQQQRIALARALATSPGLLLLDEPLSALDAKVRARLRHEIKDLQKRLGVTTIMVTHDQEEALTMADRIVVMNQGVIEQIGTPVEIYRDPKTAFVADFIGTMNFVDTEVLDGGRIRIGQVELTLSEPAVNGAATAVMGVRPEDVNVKEEAGPDSNCFDVEVKSLEFLGSFVRAELGGSAIGDTVLVADFSINLMRRVEVREGMALTVRLPAERIHLYPKAAGDGR